MTDRPINCKPWEVCALLDGRKTMTRRLAWRKPPDQHAELHDGRMATVWQCAQAGERLWVREAWSSLPRTAYHLPKTVDPSDADMAAYYRADFDRSGRPIWRPSIHMPRWASRLTLIVTATKIEKLLDITEEDARAEGFAGGKIDDGFGARNFGDGWTVKSLGVFASATGMFQLAWKGLHPKWDGFSSPEVVALTFRIVRANIDSAEARAA